MSYMTMGDEIHALRTTLARVEAERNEYRDLADKWRDDWTAAMDSRDALAAHVETAKGVMHRLIETERYMRGPRPPAVQEYLDWMDATPTTSLARLKAEWQAEALKSFANWLPSDYEGSEFQAGIDQARQHAKDCAARNRRQAEGGTHDTPQESG